MSLLHFFPQIYLFLHAKYQTVMIRSSQDKKQDFSNQMKMTFALIFKAVDINKYIYMYHFIMKNEGDSFGDNFNDSC